MWQGSLRQVGYYAENKGICLEDICMASGESVENRVGRGGPGGVGTGLGSARALRYAHHYTTTTVTVLALLLPISVSTALNNSAHHSR